MKRIAILLVIILAAALFADLVQPFGASAATTTYVSDPFTRTVTDSWSSAPTGGAYTLAGTAANFDVDGAAGTMSLPAVNTFDSAYLNSVLALNVDATFRVKADKVAQGGGQIVYFVARRLSEGNEYLGRIRYGTDGGIYLQAAEVTLGTQTLLGSGEWKTSLTQAANSWVRVRVQVSGTAPTTVRMRAWADGTTEPTTWDYTATGAAASLQQAGSVGLRSYLSYNATNAPVLFSFDDFVVTDIPLLATATPTPTNTAPPSATPTRSPTSAATATRTATSAATATRTNTSLATATRTATSAATATRTNTLAATPTRTNTLAATATRTNTLAATATRTPTSGATATKTSTPVPTSQAKPNTYTPTPTKTATRTPTSSGPTATRTATPKPTNTPTPGGSTLYWGAYIDGGLYGVGDPPWDMRAVDTFESHTKKKVSIIHWFQPWKMKDSSGTAVYQPFQTTANNNIRAHGSIPLISWGSWEPSSGVSQTEFKLSNITAGKHDAFIKQWATDAKNWGHPFFLRFDWEMNGSWFPWGEGTNSSYVIPNGNVKGDFIKAWQHVRNIFTSVGATNVTWVWCPNRTIYTYDVQHQAPLSQVYPGDSYVNWTCIDGYNWGTDRGNVWQSFSTVFSKSYNDTLTVAPSKPIMLGETSSSENGGSKSAWLSDALSTQLPKYFPKFKALIWFNDRDGDPTLDWPIESSSTSQSAYATAIGSVYYAVNSFGSITTSPIPVLK